MAHPNKLALSFGRFGSQAASLSLVLLLISCSTAFAWSSAGHMVIAAEAWHELSPGRRGKVAEVLKSHPALEQWKESFQPGKVEFSEYIFMRASTWPDEIRRHHSKFDHPHWHYIDYPLKPPHFPIEPSPSPEDDILYGIDQCEKVLADAKALAVERAVYLSWLLHLIGDLHQPLHCACMFNDTFPSGDKGGNDFYVRPGVRGIKLHTLWDGLLGTSGKPQSRVNYAIEIQSEYSRKSLKELKAARTAKDWSLESRSLAIENAYLQGDLKGSTSADAAPELPSGYTKAAKAVAEKQAALAGYRLVDELREHLK